MNDNPPTLSIPVSITGAMSSPSGHAMRGGMAPVTGAGAEAAMVYLLHFDRPIGSYGKGTAQHYLGSASDVDARLEDHRAGKGARLTQVVAERGIQMRIVRTWEGGRKEERKLKGTHHRSRLCPECNPRYAVYGRVA